MLVLEGGCDGAVLIALACFAACRLTVIAAGLSAHAFLKMLMLKEVVMVLC